MAADWLSFDYRLQREFRNFKQVLLWRMTILMPSGPSSQEALGVLARSKRGHIGLSRGPWSRPTASDWECCANQCIVPARRVGSPTRRVSFPGFLLGIFYNAYTRSSGIKPRWTGCNLQLDRIISGRNRAANEPSAIVGIDGNPTYGTAAEAPA